jgi:hypothetical protein
VTVGEGRDLRQMSHGQHLGVASQLGQPAPHLDRRPATDAGVDLVEHERRHRRRVGQHHLEREHDP